MSTPDDRAGELTALAFADLRGWREDDHAAAFAAFLRSAAVWEADLPADGSLGVSGKALAAVGALARTMPGLTHDRTGARSFFEAHFTPVAIPQADGSAFLTGYFEPEVAASRKRDGRFRYPLHRPPTDLVAVAPGLAAGLDPELTFARQTGEGLRPCPDRGAIMDGALDGDGLELVWLDNPVDAFFIHVQGSARLRLTDGSAMRIAYAAKSGHPYTSLGKTLIARGIATPETMTLAHLRAWLEADAQAGAALMRENRSYIFFRALADASLDPDLGAIAAAGVQITPGRSLAVDHRFHAYGTPIWLDADLPVGPEGNRQTFARLVIAQDTGSAILGPARGDIFFGTGATAEAVAGRIRHVPHAVVMLVPKEVAA